MKKRPNITFWLVIAIQLLNTQLSKAQSQYIFEHYDTKVGLGAQHSRSFLQDTLGYIWIHHEMGLSRFDGYSFKVYGRDPADSSGLGYTFDGSLLRDPFGNIWEYNNQRSEVGKFNIHRYDYRSDRFEAFTPDLGGALVNRVFFPKVDSLIWLGMMGMQNGEGLFSFNLKSRETRNYQNIHPDKQIQWQINTIRDIKDYGSFLLLATRKGLWKFDKNTKSFSRPECHPKDTSLLYSSGIDRIMDGPDTDDYNDVWLKIQGTLVKINSNLSIVQRFDLPEAINWNKWDRDKEGVFWFIGGGLFNPSNGISKFNPKDSSIVAVNNILGESQSLQTSALTDIFIDRDQNIWVSTFSNGIYKISKPEVHFHNFDLGAHVSSYTVYNANGTDYLLIGLVDFKNPLPNQFLIAPIDPASPGSLTFKPLKIATPIDGRVNFTWMGDKTFWIGTVANGVMGFPVNPQSKMIEPDPPITLRNDSRNPNTISGDNTTGVWEDIERNIWVGTNRNGLNKVVAGLPYGTDGSVVRYKQVKSDSNSIGSGDIWWEFCQEDANSFWVVTASGVDLFRNNRFEHFFKNDYAFGLFKPSESTLIIGAGNGLYEGIREGNSYRFNKNSKIKGIVCAIQYDRLGRLWFCNQSGVVFYDQSAQQQIEFSDKDGIKHTRDRMWHASNGFLITANEDGITLFDPTTFQVNRNKTSPVLTGLMVNNRLVRAYEVNSASSDISILDLIELDYKHNNFSFEFSAMEMTAPEKNLYRHKLEGYDEDWIETNYKNRTATYTNLPPGEYTFRVKASNHHGVWSDNERALKVIILPPPWRTWWAYAGYGLLVAGLLYWARSNIVQRERLKSNLTLEKVEREKEHFELEKAKEVDRVKTSFFTNISHEFRTPLTLIKGPVQNILEKYKDDPKLQEQLKLVQRNSDLLLKLINQLLDLAKLESGSLKVEKSEGNVFSLVRAIASSFESFARQKNVSIQVNVPEGNCSALFDKDKVETILINLINNAIKFTPQKGNISVLAKFEASPPTPLQGRGGFSLSSGEGRGEALTLIVRDTGIGIPLDQQTKIFERFHQVSEAHKEVGTGIGLALVKELVALMGGTITVESKPGEGSEFKVVLPIEIVRVITEGESRTEVSAQQSISEPRGQMSNVEYRISNVEVGTGKPHVLVVEDNSDLRAFIIDSLGNEFHFLEAGDGKQGLEIATREVPDLIISDVMMPEMDGITMAGKIKTDIRTSHIPLILLTAKSTEESKLSGLQSGADDYLTKPFNKNELLLKVRNGVNRQLKLRERLRAELMSTAPKVEVLSEDEKFLNSVKEKILERLSDEQLSVESLADDMGISRVQLYRKVSGLTGISVNELIRKLRLQRAAQLLQQNWGPVSQVAYEVGFSNLSYFSKVFKEEFGALPSEYDKA